MLSINRYLLSLAVFIATVALLGFGVFIAPRVDEHIGFLAARAMKYVQSYQVNGLPLHSVVEHEFKDVHWRAYHQDIPFQTFVECVGTTRNGELTRRMVWYVEERPRWDNGPSLRIIFMTALNRDALQLTPHLFDPRAGFGLEKWRHGVELP